MCRIRLTPSSLRGLRYEVHCIEHVYTITHYLSCLRAEGYTIATLARFYNVVLWSDEESDSDATEIMLQDCTVDDHMEELLEKWGME